ncbi:hypothetical protein CBR_g38778 [Chara braunii]|uniref:Acyl-[acyl-carrier-protein] desaturase n=1 Tax=Chara braunii TaxID=69332 RepID=A0A388LQ88_CHABU|nr:hypothetical protein CBR_g38778 [Chara braunii]|eukprot:GBG84496.1 hypothetical protein CBR_g38778 [Chara braunii]
MAMATKGAAAAVVGSVATASCRMQLGGWSSNGMGSRPSATLCVPSRLRTEVLLRGLMATDVAAHDFRSKAGRRIHSRAEAVSASTVVPAGAGAQHAAALRKSRGAPVDLGKTHSMSLEQLEIVKSMDSWAGETLLPLLKPIERSWQPSDYLPDSSSESFYEDVRELRKRALEIPDDYFVVLVGDMITEEALPTYQTMLNTLDGTRDETGASPTPWGKWTRTWTAEENRHGDALNRYLYLSGRVNMRAVEKTIQYLIGSGMDPKTENNPYLGFVYTSFQERATFISHGNTARHAKEYGDMKLANLCGTIAADERRHEIAYTLIVEKLFELDPNGTMLAFYDMMKKGITMPAHLMYDGESQTLFDDFSAVAQRLGVYTAADYASILQHLVKRWKVENIPGLSGEAAKAQDFVCKLPSRIVRLAERAESKRAKDELKTARFSWVHNREVLLN